MSDMLRVESGCPVHIPLTRNDSAVSDDHVVTLTSLLLAGLPRISKQVWPPRFCEHAADYRTEPHDEPRVPTGCVFVD